MCAFSSNACCNPHPLISPHCRSAVQTINSWIKQNTLTLFSSLNARGHVLYQFKIFLYIFRWKVGRTNILDRRSADVFQTESDVYSCLPLSFSPFLPSHNSFFLAPENSYFINSCSFHSFYSTLLHFRILSFFIFIFFVITTFLPYKQMCPTIVFHEYP